MVLEPNAEVKTIKINEKLSKKLDKKTWIIIGLVVIIACIGGVYAYEKITENAYQKGFQDAVLTINSEILSNLQQNGYINFVYTINNETRTIPLVPYVQQSQNQQNQEND